MIYKSLWYQQYTVPQQKEHNDNPKMKQAQGRVTFTYHNPYNRRKSACLNMHQYISHFKQPTHCSVN